MKIHGGPFQSAGIPDLLGCVNGLFFGLEVKVPKRGKVSRIQEVVMAKIRNKGQGIAAVVTSPEEACDVVRSAVAKSKAGCRFCSED